ncbi:hypothetical protein [Myceligenerans salitolerans]|uniref:Uncharacterized protein n=1 Tax=Myceligenerans salitolerans TaxID=1230528 RepID=A0ABS3IA35_9MICO|nr:hypothetical protein [Myceligenerans salitolerans]MBO0609862.1 hypothetical protein [Myceligenerans salitolerans]
MSSSGPTSRTVVTRTTLTAVILGVLGVLADAAGLVSFFSGKDMPGLMNRATRQPAAESPTNAPASPIPPQSSVAPDAPERRDEPEPEATEDVVTPATGNDAVDEPQTSELEDALSETARAPSRDQDAVPNMGLSLSPPDFPASDPRTILIEVADATPDTYVDVEIADPASEWGGGCPEIEPSDNCNLLASDGERTDAVGYMAVEFEWFGYPGHDGIHHPGEYTVTVRDRATGAVLSLEFIAY